MNQLSLYLTTPVRARRKDPATSQAAAAKVDKFASGHYGMILEALTRGGPGTFKEIGERCGLERHAVARRLPELQDAGKVTRTAETRDGCSVWKAAA